MTALIWRVIIAIFCCIIAFALIPPVFRIIGFEMTSDLMIILRVCIAGLAILYILRGRTPPPLV